MRFRFFDPVQHVTVDGEVRGATDIAELVSLVLRVPSSHTPAIEFADHNGAVLVLGICGTRAVLLWTDAQGRSAHTASPSIDLIEDGVVFDYFGAYAEMPASYGVPIDVAVHGVREFLATGDAPSAVLVLEA
jgi:hypothetical protein